MSASLLKNQASAPGALPLGSFRVVGFRAFADLQIKELGRVNLFVGMNNAGKTTLLEAINLYAGGANPTRIRQLLYEREEIRKSAAPEVLDAALNRLFHANDESRATLIGFGPVADSERELTIERGWATRYPIGDAVATRFSPSEPDDPAEDSERAFEVRLGRSDIRVIPIHRLFGRISFGTALATLTHPLYPAFLVPANGYSSEDVAYSWDRVALTDEEELVTDVLRIITPDVDRISVIGDANGTHERRVMVRVRGQTTPVPLRTMGDGMNRLLGIALALANARDGILLVDEIENGLHYSVQTDVWRTILNAARSLNVQVFATTHSWDCIRAFASAASEAHGVHGMLHRLERAGDGHVRSIDIGEEDLAIVARQRIEVR